jgi:hypothetical protein
MSIWRGRSPTWETYLGRGTNFAIELRNASDGLKRQRRCRYIEYCLYEAISSVRSDTLLDAGATRAEGRIKQHMLKRSLRVSMSSEIQTSLSVRERSENQKATVRDSSTAVGMTG